MPGPTQPVQGWCGGGGGAQETRVNVRMLKECFRSERGRLCMSHGMLPRVAVFAYAAPEWLLSDGPDAQRTVWKCTGAVTPSALTRGPLCNLLLSERQDVACYWRRN